MHTSGKTPDEHRYAIKSDDEETLIDAEKISKANIDVMRKLSRDGNLLCPVCKGKVIPKLGEVLKWHFSHAGDNEYKYHEPESPQHKLSKELLQHQMRNVLSVDWVIKDEVRIPETNQIADVLLRNNDIRVALEIQYSPISATRWRERHELYAEAGVRDIWILGHTWLPKGLRAGKQQIKPNQLVAALLAEHESVIYLNPYKKQLTFYQFSAQASLIANNSLVIPKVPCLVHKFPLSKMYLGSDLELRIKND